MNPRKQHIGIKYGHLTGVKYTYTDKKDGAALWLWRCDCGNEREIKAKVVTAGRTRTCGQCQLKHKLMVDAATRRAPRNKKLIREYQKYIRRAQRRELKWALSIEEFNRLVHTECSLCNSPPSQGSFQIVEPLANDQGYTVGGTYTRCHDCDVAFCKVEISKVIRQIMAAYKHLVARKD